MKTPQKLLYCISILSFLSPALCNAAQEELVQKMAYCSPSHESLMTDLTPVPGQLKKLTRIEESITLTGQIVETVKTILIGIGKQKNQAPLDSKFEIKAITQTYNGNYCAEIQTYFDEATFQYLKSRLHQPHLEATQEHLEILTDLNGIFRTLVESTSFWQKLKLKACGIHIKQAALNKEDSERVRQEKRRRAGSVLQPNGDDNSEPDQDENSSLLGR